MYFKISFSIIIFFALSAHSQNTCISLFIHHLFSESSQALKSDWTREANAVAYDKGAQLDLSEFVKFESQGNFPRDYYFKKFGFDLTSQEKKVPDPLNFIVNYNAEMMSRGLMADQFIKPALIFMRKNPNNLEEIQYQILDPLREPEPEASQGWHPYKLGDGPANIPREVVHKALRSGKFPLLMIHDISHFLGFTRNPEVAIVVAEIAKSWPETLPNENFINRQFWFFEYAMFFDPRDNNKIRNYLSRTSDIEAMKTRDEIKVDLQSISDQALQARALTSAKMMNSSLVDMGGALVSSWEKIEDLSTLVDTSILNGRLAQGNAKISTIAAFHQKHIGHPVFPIDVKHGDEFDFSNGKLQSRYRDNLLNFVVTSNLRAFPLLVSSLVKIMRKNSDELGWELATFESQSGIKGFTDLIPESYTKDGKVVETTRPVANEKGRNFLRDLLIDFTSVNEFAMAHAVFEMSGAEMVRAILKTEVHSDDPIARYWQQIYPRSIKKANMINQP